MRGEEQRERANETALPGDTAYGCDVNIVESNPSTHTELSMPHHSPTTASGLGFGLPQVTAYVLLSILLVPVYL